MGNKDLYKKIAIEKRNMTKALNTLMGMVSGLVCDGVLHDKEILYLSTWLKEYRAIAESYPANIIFKCVHEVLRDGVISQDERAYLLKELTALSGNDFADTGAALPDPIQAVFDDTPAIVFDKNVFVLTGEFLYGSRNCCHQAIEKRGGIAESNVTRRTNYLVVGSMASADWITANFGRKIQKAATMAESANHNIAIIKEADWAMAL